MATETAELPTGIVPERQQETDKALVKRVLKNLGVDFSKE